MKHTEPTREMMMVTAIADWDANPRKGELRGIEEFAAQIVADGGVKEDLHVFSKNGVITCMQGHRRKAACAIAGIGSVWVKDYGKITEREAFEILLSLQLGCDPFDARELSIAARTAVHEMGMTASEVAKVFHRTEERVQMYLDLDTLPHRVQEALYAGKITMELVPLFLQMPTKTMQEEALGYVVREAITQQPMSTAQAEVFIKDRYLKAIQREAAWTKLLPTLLKRHKLDDGFSFVDFAQRADFVLAESLPQDGYARADEHIDDELLANPREPLTWGALAAVYGVPVFVVPAMALADKYLLLVRLKAVRECDGVSDEPRLRGRAAKAKGKQAESQEEPTPADAAFTKGAQCGTTMRTTDAAMAMAEEESERHTPRPTDFPADRWDGIMALASQAGMQTAFGLLLAITSDDGYNGAEGRLCAIEEALRA